MEAPFVRITAIVRTSKIGAVTKALCACGIEGLTATRVMGLGEYRNYFCRNPMVEHAKFDIFIEKAKAARIVDIIVQAARTGSSGDGLVAVAPLLSVTRIRGDDELSEARSPSTT